MRKEKGVDIIVVTYNAPKELERCISGIRVRTAGLDYRLTVVVNDDKGAATLGVLSRLQPGINVIRNWGNCGFSKAANIAIRSTNRPYIALVDDDVEVTSGWLRGLLNSMRKSDCRGIVGCKVLSPGRRIFCSHVTLASGVLRRVGYGEADTGQKDYARSVAAVNGACWLMRRELTVAAGLFDERFFPSQYEDIDYCLRARRAGYKVFYNGAVSVLHRHMLRDGGERRNLENWRKFRAKWPDGEGVRPERKRPFSRKVRALASCVASRASRPVPSNFAGANVPALKARRSELEARVRSNPRDYDARHRLALIYHGLGLSGKAKAEAEKVLNFFHLVKARKGGRDTRYGNSGERHTK